MPRPALRRIPWSWRRLSNTNPECTVIRLWGNYFGLHFCRAVMRKYHFLTSRWAFVVGRPGLLKDFIVLLVWIDCRTCKYSEEGVTAAIGKVEAGSR